MNGSELVIHRVGPGTEEVILTTDDIIEAPNWTPDGKALIVNGGGLLFRVSLDAPGLDLIDTGFANRLNNDHGVSPDGQRLAISDKTEEGESCIYLLPAEGGRPTRVTPLVPSYWHSWSPDGGRLAYCARRGGGYVIATSAVDGSDEVVLTEPGYHSDGPDYTPDGQWIWFNCDKPGHAQIYRIRPDGRDMQRMTDDARVNWFPHPAPDGSTVLYLAYPEGTLYHPPGLDVELRMMDPEGGNIRTVARLYGGQGTINVPCWSPDSSAFAYIRYRR